MKCQECNNEFSPINYGGLEQKYCSKTCRNKASHKRRLNNYAEKLNYQKDDNFTVDYRENYLNELSSSRIDRLENNLELVWAAIWKIHLNTEGQINNI